MIKYNRKEVEVEALKYFNGDTLARDVWINKYALKDSFDNVYELTPNDMNKRIAKELSRIENKYPNPLSEEKIFNLIKDFKYIVPAGGSMSGIGNNLQIVSLSNCFVIGNESDSYGGITMTDQQQVQLMKRRGGVGHDLSHIRPKGSPVKNSALTSTGVVPFMERFSNSTKEVAQDGRRGALMLSLSIKHPDIEDFIDAKLTEGKVTSANISVKLDDEFMKCALNDKSYIQQFPINSDNPIIKKEINAKDLWKKIIHNAWRKAEPGLMFWDTIIKESIPDCYADQGFATKSTNPCGEIPLNPYDSCRLLSLNLYSYVDNPFTKDAKFNFDLFKEHVQYAQRFMDDIVDLEIEKIDTILEKIDNDPEPEEMKIVERSLWEKIREKGQQGRRTGLGITAEGDMLAALGLIYGTSKATKFAELVHKTHAVEAYKSSIIMAEERGSFKIWNYNNEINNPFIQRIVNELDEDFLKRYTNKGRRNIALLTIAPVGSGSIMTQTTSGIEPVFFPSYKRNRKVNPNDKNAIIDHTDSEGVAWEKYNVFHPKFKVWANINGYNSDELEKLSEKELDIIIEKSPYYKATANDVNWVEKVKMQGAIQKWVDHSISVTVNLPANATEEIVSKVYETGWKSGCKGITVYRDGCRDGVLETKTEQVVDIFREINAPRRPRILNCEVMRFQNKGEKWIGFLGLLGDEPKPYEIFSGLLEAVNIPSYVEQGEIVKIKKDDGEVNSRYDFRYIDKDGYTQEFRGLSRAFNREFWNVGRMISGILRHGMPLPNVLSLIDKIDLGENSSNDITSWKSGIKRMIKKYIRDGTKIHGSKCPDCDSINLIFKEGCKQCIECGSGKCE